MSLVQPVSNRFTLWDSKFVIYRRKVKPLLHFETITQSRKTGVKERGRNIKTSRNVRVRPEWVPCRNCLEYNRLHCVCPRIFLTHINQDGNEEVETLVPLSSELDLTSSYSVYTSSAQRCQ